MDKLTPPTPRVTRLIGVAVRRGQQRITLLIAPALRVVREPGKLPRVEVITPGVMS